MLVLNARSIYFQNGVFVKCDIIPTLKDPNHSCPQEWTEQHDIVTDNGKVLSCKPKTSHFLCTNECNY